MNFRDTHIVRLVFYLAGLYLAAFYQRLSHINVSTILINPTHLFFETGGGRERFWRGQCESRTDVELVARERRIEEPGMVLDLQEPASPTIAGTSRSLHWQLLRRMIFCRGSPWAMDRSQHRVRSR